MGKQPTGLKQGDKGLQITGAVRRAVRAMLLLRPGKPAAFSHGNDCHRDRDLAHRVVVEVQRSVQDQLSFLVHPALPAARLLAGRRRVQVHALQRVVDRSDPLSGCPCGLFHLIRHHYRDRHMPIPMASKAPVAEAVAVAKRRVALAAASARSVASRAGWPQIGQVADTDHPRYC